MIPAAPINLIDRHTNTVTVLTPHNACALQFTARSADAFAAHAGTEASGMPAMPPLPAGIGLSPQAGRTPQPGTIGPDFSHCRAAQLSLAQAPPQAHPLPRPPAQHDHPLPPSDYRGHPAEPTGMPTMPAMPAARHAGMDQVWPAPHGTALDPHRRTAELHGFPCRKYSLSLPLEGS